MQCCNYKRAKSHAAAHALPELLQRKPHSQGVRDACMLHTWSTDRNTRIVSRRLLYLCDWPIILTHFLERDALRMQPGLVHLCMILSHDTTV